MTKVVLTSHEGSYNRGCEAIVRSTVSIINHHLPKTEITLLSRNPDSDREVGITELENLQIADVSSFYPSKKSLRWYIDGLRSRLAAGRPTIFSFAHRFFLKDADLVMSIGGDMFTDDYGGPDHLFRELAFARSFGALTVIWAASIGPFRDKQLEQKWARELRKVDLITVRETTSLKYLEDLGVTENVQLVADPAFLLAADPRGVDFVADKSRTTVGLGMSGWVAGYGPGKEQYLAETAAFAESILADDRNRLVLIPHVFMQGANDAEFCRLLAERLPKTSNVVTIGSSYNACQLKHIIAQCDFFIGARTHSTIASLSSGVPTISIAYSRKAYGINQEIFGHTDYVLDIKDLTADLLRDKYGLLQRNRDSVIDHLKQQIPALEAAADKGGQYLANLLHQRGKV